MQGSRRFFSTRESAKVLLTYAPPPPLFRPLQKISLVSHVSQPHIVRNSGAQVYVSQRRIGGAVPQAESVPAVLHMEESIPSSVVLPVQQLQENEARAATLSLSYIDV